MILSRVLGTPECAVVLPYGQSRAVSFHTRLLQEGQREGRHTETVFYKKKKFFITIDVIGDDVRLVILTENCPNAISGLVDLDYVHPTAMVAGSPVFRGVYLKAKPLVFADTKRLLNNYDQFLTVRPGLFTGEMRKVVQVLQGSGQRIGYLSNASVTHGVYTGHKNAKWIIKVSSAGVFAYPMKTCTASKPPTSLGYTPLPTPEPKKPLELISADIMRGVYANKGAFYGLCGWAFSASGHLIANCLLGTQGSRYYAYQYQITITPDPKTGDPLSATVSVLAEGYIHGPRTTHMKFPFSDNPATVASFDPYGGNPNYVYDCATPIFCYYSGEDLQTYYYTHAPSKGYTRNIPNETNGKHGWCDQFTGMRLHYPGTITVSAIPVIKFNDPRPEFKTYDPRDAITIGPNQFLGMGFQGFSGWPGNIMQIYKFTQTTETGLNRTDNDKTNVLVVSGWDREAAYLVTRTITTVSSYTYNIGEYAISREGYQWVDQVPCLETGLGGFNSATVGPQYFTNGANDPSCDGGQMRYWLGGYYYFPGGGPGGTYKFREHQIINGALRCVPIYGDQVVSIPAAQGVINVVIPAATNTDYQLILRGSDGAYMGIGTDSFQMERWLNFIDPSLSSQYCLTIRDAFKGTRMAYTINTDQISPLQLGSSGFDPYQLPLIRSSNFFFVGEP